MIMSVPVAIICIAVLSVWGIVLTVRKVREVNLRRKMGLQETEGFQVHPGRFYHPGHTWVEPEANGTVRVGLDDFGRRLVEGVRKVELPAKGDRLREGDPAVGLKAGTKHARIVSPVDGIVTAINDKLGIESSTLERDPYGKGWLFAIKVADRNFASLPTGPKAIEWLKSETARLSVFFTQELGLTAADGGELIHKPRRVLTEEQWSNLMRTFFGIAPNGVEKPARQEI